MTSMSTVVMMAGVAVALLLSALLAAAVTGLSRMNRVRALALLELERPGAERLTRLTDRSDRFLNPVLLVMLALQVAQTGLVVVLADRLAGGAGVVVGLAVDVAVVFVLVEAAPKTWALEHVDQAALLSARPVFALVRLAPLRWLSRGLIGLANVVVPGKGLERGPFVSEEQLLDLADVAAEADVIEVEERALIRQIIEFGDTIVREVMVARTDMVTVDADFRVADVMEVVLLNGFSRVPVVGDGIDDVVGVAYAKDLMRAERDGREARVVGELARPAHFVPETKRVAELLREMQAETFHMAIVIDEYGGTAGLVTLEDLIEELVGEIVDEYDVEDPRVEPLPGGEVRVNGRLAIDDANDVLDTDLPEGEWDTVGGLVFTKLGRIAAVGDTVEVPGARLVVDKVQGRRISRVRISRSDAASAVAATAIDRSGDETAGAGVGDRSQGGSERQSSERQSSEQHGSEQHGLQPR